MIVIKVKYSRQFIKRFKKLPKDIARIAVQKERLFKLNPLHPSLRLHQLAGKLNNFWSISITYRYRIIFKREITGDITFISIGKHDIYKYL